MTVVGLNPATPAMSPRRRTLLPRNPTPWASPEIPTLPSQVQRLLQQIGGSSYQTYQPFQVVQPLITPQPTVSFTDYPESSTSTKKSSTSVSQDLENDHNSHTGLPQVNLPFSTSAFNHSTTSSSSVCSNPDHSALTSPLPLTRLCRNRLVSHFGLRKLRRILLSMRAPKCVAKFLSTVCAKECVVRSSAPLLDVFEEPFFHRAITWQVECCLDGQPYLATYAHTDTSALVQCEWMTSSHVGEEEQDARSSAWLYCEHPHVMRVWGVVVDPNTGNNFYLLDTPIASLDQILTRLHQRSVRLPEPQVWGLVGGVSSALLHARRGGLPYAPLQLSNVFLLPSAVVIENGLTRKQWFNACSCSSSRGCCEESCFVQNVGRIIYALCTCGTRSQHVHVEGTRAHYGAVMRDLSRQYSHTLLTLLARTLGGGDQGPGIPGVPTHWGGNHNGRRVFADVNKPTSLPRVRNTANDSEDLHPSENKSVNEHFSSYKNILYSSSDSVTSRPSPSSFSSSTCPISVSSLSSVSSSASPFHSSLSNSSDFPSSDAGAFVSAVPDVCLAAITTSQGLETNKIQPGKSSSDAYSAVLGLQSHSQPTASRSAEPLTTQCFSQPHFTFTSHNSSASKESLTRASKKLNRRPSLREASTRPKGEPIDNKHPNEKRRKRAHQRRRHFAESNTSKENVSPAICGGKHRVSITNTTKGDKLTSSNDVSISASGLEAEFPLSFAGRCRLNAQEDAGRDDSSLYLCEDPISLSTHLKIENYNSYANATFINVPASSSANFRSISLEEIVMLAEAEVRRTSGGGGLTLEEALRRSPRELVELAMSQLS